jgi:DNA polymerase III subunit delta'
MTQQVKGFPNAAAAFAAALSPALASCRPAKVLGKALETGRLAHAILLHGEDLAELSAVAEALAGALLSAKGDVSRHPDFIALRPGGKARQIRIGDRGDSGENTMRAFLHQISQTPGTAPRKVAAVYEADRMNAATANAFLKTLEEPPADTTLLLVSTRPYDLLDTIRSRCFHFRIDSSSAAKARDEGWKAWLTSYGQWLGRVAAKPRRPDEIAAAVMGAYALSAGFSEELGAIADREWTVAKEKLPENLPDEQVAAMEAGSRKGVRQRLLADVEAATLAFAREAGGGTVPKLIRVHAIAEGAAKLCDVFNMKEDAALEWMLLSGMRQWGG